MKISTRVLNLSLKSKLILVHSLYHCEVAENIYPNLNFFISRSKRELALRQSAKVIWLMGLSGSGKSTLAKALENDLFKRGYTCFVLDGDNVRNGLNRDLGFSEQDRNENIRRIAEVAKLFVDAGIIVICSCITPFEHQRQIAKQIIGEIDYYLIYVNTPVEVCERRDVKGLYAKAKRSEMLNFTGVNSPFEEPQELNLVVNTDGKSVEDILREMLDAVLPLIQINSTVREK